MSLLKANSVQIGQSSTATNNFTLSVPSSPDGTIKLARGNSGATTADVLSVASGGDVIAYTNNTERLRIDSSGNVGIGTSSPSVRLHVSGPMSSLGSPFKHLLSLIGTDSMAANNGSGIVMGGAIDGSSTTAFTQIAGLKENATSGDVAGYLSFFTRPSSGQITERLRINSSGDVLIGNAGYVWDERLLVRRTENQVAAGFYVNNSSFTSNIIICQSETAAGTGWRLFSGRSSNGVERIIIYGNGNLQNTNGSYGAISDIALKENIVDATPKLSDICRVKVRNYSLKDDETNTKQIGVVAQELEEIFPSLVEGTEGNKGVKYSVFIPMLIKAVQELSAKVTALEAA